VKSLYENLAKKKKKFKESVATFAKLARLKFSRSDSLDWVEYVLDQAITSKAKTAKQAKTALKLISDCTLTNPINQTEVNDQNLDKVTEFKDLFYIFGPTVILEFASRKEPQDWSREEETLQMAVANIRQNLIKLPNCRRLEL
jgi:hypothetical protein